MAKFWEYQKTNCIFGFLTLKLAGMQIFEFPTQVHHQKLNFDPILPLYAQIRKCDVIKIFAQGLGFEVPTTLFVGKYNKLPYRPVWVPHPAAGLLSEYREMKWFILYVSSMIYLLIY